ncbi:long-chain fatty acid--CoA ligase [Pontibacillus yanchengensis Y32]|uniref:Long-chain fatty acid--CoA ligase n=1 Tax=Pontibacillus yanchengensis Y32 TaxID=1385514 RepID=A0A0A2T6F0_9BACI|nr:long-chain fatty acid--CoA ligase [Pontibacillus yanchengensis]KGP71084.1 long-chain fatty acid--CoA ligase [Pontibacillus yanchengensis Y32]
MKCEVDWIEGRARLYPNAVGVVDADTGESWTFEQLNNRAIRLASYFQDKGIRKGDRLGLLAPNHISYMDFLFACMKLGAIFVPLNWRLSQEELSFVIQDSNPSYIGLHSSFGGNHEWYENFAPLIHIKDNEYLNTMGSGDVGPFQVMYEIEETDSLAMIYTGGTTGKPKGAVLTHQSIMWNALNTIVSWNLGRDDCTLTCLPMFHTGGLNALSVPVLMAGGKVALSSSFDAEQAVLDIDRYQCTIVLLVPTMYHMLVRTRAFEQTTFPSMKVFLSGGAPCPFGVYDAFAKKGVQFKEGYGLTEAGPNNFYIDPAVAHQKKGSVGKAMVFNDIKILTSDGKDAKVDEVGELLLKGKHTFSYYWNRPDATKNTWNNGWLHTGDLARQDDEGYVYIVGRKKEMIITGGENVYPLEIEHWLESHESVNEVAVIGVPDEKWGEIVTAFVSVDEKASITEDELRSYCKYKLAGYKIPKTIVIVPDLPKTDVGKIDKKGLLQQYSVS